MALKQCEEEASEGLYNLYLNDKGLAAKYAIQNVWTTRGSQRQCFRISSPVTSKM